MSDDNNWIKKLKKGDKIYICSDKFLSNIITLTTVKKVTAKGYIRVENGDLYYNGNCKIDTWTQYFLKQYNPEIEAHYNHMCCSINFQDMLSKPYDKVKRIFDILNEVE